MTININVCSKIIKKHGLFGDYKRFDKEQAIKFLEHDVIDPLLESDEEQGHSDKQLRQWLIAKIKRIRWERKDLMEFSPKSVAAKRYRTETEKWITGKVIL